MFGGCNQLSPVFVLIITLVCLPSMLQATVPNSSDKKIAFLFMSRNHMYLEDIWHEFFRWHTNESHYTIYNHVHRGYKFPRNSFFYGKELPLTSLESTGKGTDGHLWGNMAQVRAIRALVREALKDPLNEWFTLMSESCLPLHNFNKIRNNLLNHDKSIINACPHMGMKEMEGDTRWRSGLDDIGFKKEWWRKSGTWFALKRKHAQIFADDVSDDIGWEKVPCCDEHYLPSLLAKHGQDNETSCTDGFTYVYWGPFYGSHPWSWDSDAITPELFHKAKTDPASGFEANLGYDGCSGISGYCHMMGRKFSPVAKYTLLENIDLILGEEEEPYEGNPWDHHQDKFRVNSTSNEYWMIENGYLRLVPDLTTLEALHHFRMSDDKGHDVHTDPLTPMDLTAYPIGMALPSRKDYELIKSPKGSTVYYLLGGKRRAVPNMDTLASLKDANGKLLEITDIKVIYETDLQQIDIGDDMPSVNDADPNVKHKIRETFKERRAKRKEVHQLGEGGGSKNTKEQQQWNKIQAAKTLSINAAVAAASQSVENSVNNKNSDGIEKWLFESQASDTNDHVPLRNEPDEEVYATQNTLLKDKVG